MIRSVECLNCEWRGDEGDVDYLCPMCNELTDEICEDCDETADEVCPYCGSDSVVTIYQNATVGE